MAHDLMALVRGLFDVEPPLPLAVERIPRRAEVHLGAAVWAMNVTEFAAMKSSARLTAPGAAAVGARWGWRRDAGQPEPAPPGAYLPPRAVQRRRSKGVRGSIAP
jgi:hypothetical protein